MLVVGTVGVFEGGGLGEFGTLTIYLFAETASGLIIA